jgi:hypothetical protein
MKLRTFQELLNITKDSCKLGSHRNSDYRKFLVQQIEGMNLLLLIMNIHMHRMMSHSIWLNCLAIVIELLGAGNSMIMA